MRAQFVDIIRRQLGDGHSLSAEQRHAVYERVRAFVQNHYRTQGFSHLDYMTAALTIEQAIGDVEAEFAQAPSFVDRAMHAAGDFAVQFKTKYGAFAGVVSTAADFIKPVVDLTQAIVIGSGVIGIALVALARGAKTSRGKINQAATFCGLLFACSLSWLGIQNFVPGANANGAIAQLVPGASALQDAVVASLGRIEQQTKRVGDILEDNVRRDREKQREETERMGKRIVDAGFSLDAKGIANAVRANYRYLGDFAQLGVKPAEGAITDLLVSLDKKEEMESARAYLSQQKDDYPFIRKIQQSIEADRGRLAGVFEGADARRRLCDKATYSYPVATARLHQACKSEGLLFAHKYSKYANEVYDLALVPVSYSTQAIDSLPVTKLRGRASLSSLENTCSYYEIEYHFGFTHYTTARGIQQSVGQLLVSENGDALIGKTISVFDPNFEQFKFADRCETNQITLRKVAACRARLLVASRCEGDEVTIVKVLSTDNAAQAARTAPALQAVQAPPPPVGAQASAAAQPTPGPKPVADGPLSAEEVRTTFLGKEIEHNGQLTLKYAPNGTFGGGDGRIGTNGTYRIEGDGRICWKNDRGFSGCFQYYRQRGALYVRRNDASNSDVIGLVKISR